jgi:succinyl-diaminopimelate desuccinylase
MEETKWSVNNAFTKLVEKNESTLLKRLYGLLKIESVLDRFDPSRNAPFGEGVNEALHYMLDLAKKDGFVTKNINNYAAHIEFGEGEELLGILCHVDVVPANRSEKWESDPFHPELRDGKIYARGAMDDKGPTMAAYMALKLLRDHVEDFAPKKRIRIILGTDEESGWRGLKEYFKTEEMPTIGFAPDALFPLIYGEKGFFNFTFEGTYEPGPLVEFYSGLRSNVVPDEAYAILDVDLKEAFERFLGANNYRGSVEGNKYIIKGKAAHAMAPDTGLNAGYLLAQFLNEHIENGFIQVIAEKLLFDALGEKLAIDYYDEEMKNLTMNNGIFRYSKEKVSIHFNCRYPKGYDVPKAEATLKKEAKKYGLEYVFESNRPVHYNDPNADLVQTLLSVYREGTGDLESQPITIGGGTYARSIPNGVAFGMAFPGRIEVAHQANEHVSKSDYLAGTMLYMAAIKRLAES